jgi:hypothetical protein
MIFVFGSPKKSSQVSSFILFTIHTKVTTLFVDVVVDVVASGAIIVIALIVYARTTGLG